MGIGEDDRHDQAHRQPSCNCSLCDSARRPAIIAVPAPVAEAIGPQCTDSSLPNRLDPVPFNGHPGRITVLFDANEITDATRPEAQARGTAIADEIQKRAEGALDRYAQLGFAVPSAATFKILCAPALGVVDRNAVTPLPGNVQFRSSYVRDQFRDAVFNGTDFSPGPWNGVCRNWWTTVDHESFHLVQGETWGLLGAAWKFLWRWEFSRFESTATLAQDLFRDVDDAEYDQCPNPDVDASGTYLRAADRFLTTLPSTDTSDNQSEAAYQVAPVYQYWAERYGNSQEPTNEDRAAEVLDRILRADDDHERALTNALGVDAFDAYREFLAAALIRKNPGVIPQRQFQDELVGFGGVGGGQAYEDVLVRTGSSPVAPTTPFSDANQVLEKYRGRVYRLNMNPAIVRAKVELTTRSTGGFGPLFQSWARPRIALLPINGDGTVDVESQYFLTGADNGVSQILTLPVGGRSQLGFIIVSTPDAFAYDLTVTDVSAGADVTIEAPTTQVPRPIGPANDLQRLDVIVRPTVLGVFEPGLPRTAFTVTIGGQPAEVLTARQDIDSYTLRVQPNGPLADGYHDLAVTFGGVTKTQTNAIIVGSRPGAAVTLVIDRSLLVWLKRPRGWPMAGTDTNSVMASLSTSRARRPYCSAANLSLASSCSPGQTRMESNGLPVSQGTGRADPLVASCFRTKAVPRMGGSRRTGAFACPSQSTSRTRGATQRPCSLQIEGFSVSTKRGR